MNHLGGGESGDFLFSLSGIKDPHLSPLSNLSKLACSMYYGIEQSSSIQTVNLSEYWDALAFLPDSRRVDNSKCNLCLRSKGGSVFSAGYGSMPRIF